MTNGSQTVSPRRAAALSIHAMVKNGKFLNLELDSAIKKYGFEDRDRRFFTRLVYGTAERMITLDAIVRVLSTVPFDQIEPMVLAIVRTALYQIFYMDRVPDSAACNEAVLLVKQLCPHSYAGFVNAILRKAARDKQELRKAIAGEKGLSGVCLRTSLPLWMLQSWEADYGCAEQIATAFSDRHSPMALRVNTLRISSDELKEQMESDWAKKQPAASSEQRLSAAFKAQRNGLFADSALIMEHRDLSATLSPWAADALQAEMLFLRQDMPCEELFGFSEGLFFIQDPSSFLCAMLLCHATAADHPLIIDCCACPGGKSFSIAIGCQDNADIYAFDLHANRLKLIADGAERLGLHAIRMEERDARSPTQALFGKADAVLCDVPCSGLGVLAKKPDIRHKSLEDARRLPAVQLEILEASGRYVKPDGVLLYSTCTLRKEENENVVYSFCERHSEFALESTDLFGPDGGMVTLFPHIHHTDGFFVAKLRKGQRGKQSGGDHV